MLAAFAEPPTQYPFQPLTDRAFLVRTTISTLAHPQSPAQLELFQISSNTSPHADFPKRSPSTVHTTPQSLYHNNKYTPAPMQDYNASSPSKRKRARDDILNASPPEEKRRRRYRSRAPQSFHPVYARALSQRFYVLTRMRCDTDDCPGEVFEIAGSTGNVYTVKIDRMPSCSCPHALKGNQCKHIIYILARVLHAPLDLVYQLAFLSTELREIFAAAPNNAGDASSPLDSTRGQRKAIEDDCPICFSPFDAQSPESIVWCRAACGQNIHQECFEMWAKTKTGSQVTCPFCRSAWEGDPEMVLKVERSRGTMQEGYLNVAEQLGMSTERDYSSYSEWFDRRRRW
ncbi:hypothetical protein E4U30_004694 [Claviceps sp. LM220 group G6]|nr:hypothetical protein E4U30_004694 [Claviceps sp. LM220 group G6]